MSEWREGKKPWKGDRIIRSTLKVPNEGSEATVVYLDEPKPVQFGDSVSFVITVGYLSGNAKAAVYDRDTKKKIEVNAVKGEIYDMWMPTTLIQQLVNLYPEEDTELTGRVNRIFRERISRSRYGPFLGYRVELVEAYNKTDYERILDNFAREAEETTESADDDLETSAELVTTSLRSLGRLNFDQIKAFLKSRIDAGLIKSEIDPAEVANYIVAKNPSGFEIEEIKLENNEVLKVLKVR